MMKGYRFQVLGYSLLFLILSTVTCTLFPTYAAESTPSSEIRTKLEELKREIASKAAKLKQEVNRKLNNKAYVGGVKHKSSTSLTLASGSGPKLVSINQDTIFESTVKGKKFSQKALVEEDYIAVLGDVDDTGVLTAKKIILLNPKPQTLKPKTYLWGQVVSVSDKLITLRDRSLKNVALTLPSEFNDFISEGKNLFIIATGSYNKNNIFETQFIYVIPQGGIIKPKKIATPSATTN